MTCHVDFMQKQAKRISTKGFCPYVTQIPCCRNLNQLDRTFTHNLLNPTNSSSYMFHFSFPRLNLIAICRADEYSTSKGCSI